MKLPKTKTGLYVVMRHLHTSDDGFPVGIFATEEGADNYAGKCEQEFLDHGVNIYHFRKTYTSFYNE